MLFIADKQEESEGQDFPQRSETEWGAVMSSRRDNPTESSRKFLGFGRIFF